jgi:tagaturonate reductase
MITVCEPYRLFVIQGDDTARRRLSFAAGEPTIVISEDITPYRERKVRLLNGVHSLVAPLALLLGCRTVADAMQHELVGTFARRVMLDEVVPSLATSPTDAEPFAQQVLDRFANPFIEHALLDITLHQTAKLRVRVVPSVLRYAAKTGKAPGGIALGLAAYVWFMRGAPTASGGAASPNDAEGAAVREQWRQITAASDDTLSALARAVCADRELWGEDLTAVAGGSFVEQVSDHLVRVARHGVAAALESHLAAAAVGSADAPNGPAA